MTKLLSEKRPKARKNHGCDACEHLLQDDWWRNGGGLSFSELRAIANAKNNGWKIKKGKTYISQRLIIDGDFYQFKAIPIIHEICNKHDVYQE